MKDWRKLASSVEVKADAPYASFDALALSVFESYVDRQEQRTIRAVQQRRGDLSLNSLKPSSIFSIPVADAQFASQVQFMVEKLIREGAKEQGHTLTDAQVEQMAEDIIMTSEKVNQTTYDEIVIAFSKARENDDDDNGGALKYLLLLLLLRKVFAKRRREAELAARATVTGAYNYGAYVGAVYQGKISKTWVSQKDSAVRPAHRELDGDTVPIDQPFYVGGVPIRFPGDPTAPLNLVIRCRCFLKYGMTL